MTEPILIAERDARDRMTDALGFGITAPIQNLPLPVEPLVVPFESRASIPLGYSQQGADYQLTTGQCSAATGAWTEGTGAALALATEPVVEDRTFSVCARKGGTTVALTQRVRVRVGLDDRLAARILLDPQRRTTVLDPTLDQPYPDTAARLTPFGSVVQVAVDDAQEGVDYTLETEPAAPGGTGATVSKQPVRGLGPGKTTTLASTPLAEDVVLRIRATREVGTTMTVLIETRLPLKVMANPDSAVALVEGPIAAYGARQRLRIEQSQRGVAYRVFARPIPDLEYRPVALPPERIATVTGPEAQVVRVALPEPSLEWTTPAGFVPISDAVAGNGGELLLPLPAALADQVLLVQAAKSHAREEASPLPSAVRLAAALVLLVRPDPAADIELAMDLSSGAATVHRGEPGVFYHLRPAAAGGGELPYPAYVHKRDPNNPALNKGLGALVIGVDLAIARSRPVGAPLPDPAREPPLPPLLETTGLTGGGELHLRAVKAQTGLTEQLTAFATIPATAEVRPDESEVAPGATARIVVVASDPADRYELTLNGESIEQPRNGNAQDLAILTGPIEADIEFVLRVTRREPQGIALVRLVPVHIRVRRGS